MSMNIAVVGDVHGHLALMYAILGRWQQESGRRIDLILQLGDMGAAHQFFLTVAPPTMRFAEFLSVVGANAGRSAATPPR
jgi:predicted phosphodiesterase